MGPEHNQRGQRLAAREIGPAVVDLIRTAKSRVVLVSPYFHPWGQLVKALAGAPARGVRVTLVVRSNQPFDPKRHLVLQKLAEAGVSIRQVPWLHLKMYLSDAAVIETSMNLVFSSMAKGYETGVLYARSQAPADYAERRAAVKSCVEGSAPYLTDTALLETKRTSSEVRGAAPAEDANRQQPTAQESASSKAQGTGSVGRSRRNNPRAYQPWTPAEDSKVRELFERGVPLVSIGQALQRTPKGIQRRLKRLGLLKEERAPAPPPSAFTLTWKKAVRWHSPVCKGDDCWHENQGNGGEDFLERLFELQLRPRGFERHPINTNAALCLTGPGLSEGSTDTLFWAIRKPLDLPVQGRR
jgi:hypothetical protein